MFVTFIYFASLGLAFSWMLSVVAAQKLFWSQMSFRTQMNMVQSFSYCLLLSTSFCFSPGFVACALTFFDLLTIRLTFIGLKLIDAFLAPSCSRSLLGSSEVEQPTMCTYLYLYVTTFDIKYSCIVGRYPALSSHQLDIIYYCLRHKKNQTI